MEQNSDIETSLAKFQELVTNNKKSDAPDSILFKTESVPTSEKESSSAKSDRHWLILWFLDEDNQQKMKVALSFFVEIYKVLVSCFLILFVPQKCGTDGHICTYAENMESDGWKLYDVALAFNFITFFCFVANYCIELAREDFLILHLDVRKDHPFDNESCGKMVLQLLPERQKTLMDIQIAYKFFTAFCTSLFVVNTVLSAIIISNYSLGNQTETTFVTNILFMLTKLSDVLATVLVEQNIFLSAYMKIKVQFNAVDHNDLKVSRKGKGAKALSNH